MAKLTEMQELFAREYLVDFNATQAAIRAGYSEKTAKSQGQRLLTRVDVLNEIRKQKDKQLERVDITADRVLQEIAYMAFADTTDYVNIETVEAKGEDGRVLYGRDGKPLMDQIVRLKDTKDLSPIQRRAIQSIKEGANGIEIKLHDKTKAVELLGKHMKLFTDKVETEHSGDIKVVLNVPSPTENW